MREARPVLIYFVLLLGLMHFYNEPEKYVIIPLEVPPRPSLMEVKITPPQKYNTSVWMRWDLILNQKGEFVPCGEDCLD